MPDDSTPLVSVMLPSYNYGRYIGDTLRSVLAQTHQNIEVIVSDDASSDDSCAVIRSFTDPRIKFIEQKKNLGNIAHYAAIYSHCRGTYVAYVDSDDTWVPTKLAEQVALLEAASDVAVAGTFIEVIDAAGNPVADSAVAAWFNEALDLADPRTWLHRNHLCQSSVLVRKAAHDRVGLRRAGLTVTADLDLWLRFLVEGFKIAVLPRVLTRYRVHQKSLWQKSGGESLWQSAFVYASVLFPWLRRLGRDELIDETLLEFAVRAEQAELAQAECAALIEAASSEMSAAAVYEDFRRYSRGQANVGRFAKAYVKMRLWARELTASVDWHRERSEKNAEALTERERHLTGAQEELKAARLELDNRQQDLSNVQAELTDTRGELGDIRDELSSARLELDDTRGALGHTRDELSSTKVELRSVQAELNNTGEQLSNARQEFVRTKTRLVEVGRSRAELEAWAAALEEAKQWHNAQRQTWMEEALRRRTMGVLTFAHERAAQHIMRLRGHAGSSLQRLMGLDRPPEVLAALRRAFTIRLRRPAGVKVGGDAADILTRPGIVLFMPFLVVGGAERVLSQIVAALKIAGFDVTVVTTVPAGPELGSAEAWFLPHVVSIRVLPQLGPRETWRDQVITLLRDVNLRAVWVAGSEFAYELLPEIKQIYPDLAVVDVLFNEVGHTANNRRHAQHIDVHVAENRQVAAWLEEHGESRDRVRVISNGVDLGHFGPNHRTVRPALPWADTVPTIGYLGRLSREKGPDIFLQIAAKVDSQIPRGFAIAGIGPEEAALRAQAEALGLGGSLVFLGAQHARSFLSACDVLVMPSRLDGRPNAVLEAMAMGVPVVAARVGGLPELVEDGETGFLCPAGSVDEFAERVALLIRDPHLRSVMGARARMKAERDFDQRAMGQAYVDLFRELVLD